MAYEEQFHVMEVHRLGGVEISVADVPAADDGDPPIGDPRLVVHAARRPEGAKRELEPPAQAVRAVATRVEEPDLDVGMIVQGEIGGIVAARVDVVDEQAHADTAIGGGNDLFRQQFPGQVVEPIVVLQVEAAAGIAGGKRAHLEGLEIIGEKGEAALPGAICQKRRDRPVECRRIVGDGQGMGRLALRPARKTAV